MWRADMPAEQLRRGYEALRRAGRPVPPTFEAAMRGGLWQRLVRLQAALLTRHPPIDRKRAAAGEREEECTPCP